MFESRGDTHSVSRFNAASLLASNMDRGDGRGEQCPGRKRGSIRQEGTCGLCLRTWLGKQ